MKNKIKKLIFVSAIASFTLFINSCNNKEESINKDTIQNKYGNITFHFTHLINNDPFITDSLIYSNAAGNNYLISEIQYFISDVTLHKNNSQKQINEWKDIHYVDTDISETHIWNVYDKIETGDYDSISFTFGISAEKNKSFLYVNPPERDMFWPEYLGGGYHYMKLNGKWQETTGVITPFDFHLGIGQIYSEGILIIDSIENFVHNNFIVTLPNSNFTLKENETKELIIAMHINNWFKSPHIFDFNSWGGYIMQNQEAMQIAKENGNDVFSIQVK